MAKDIIDWDEVSRRLRALQQAEKATSAQMGKVIGVSRSTWESYIRKEREIPPEAVLKLKLRYGLKSDWFYGADAVGNDPEMQKKIDAALDKPEPRRRGRPLRSPE